LAAAQRALVLAEKEKLSSAIKDLNKRIADLQKRIGSGKD